MTNAATRKPMIALTLGAALASTALAGCTAKSAPAASVSAAQVQKSLAKGKVTNAVAAAEQAVQAEPRSADYRALLAATYMESGRFQSAAQTFADAMELGDASPRTALSMALALIAAGDHSSAHKLLTKYERQIDPVDLGLAMSLSGDVNHGVAILRDVVRSGRETPKARQNLAYAFALQGNWSAARIMAAMDVPADQLDARIREWASVARPEQDTARIAQLLQVPVVPDSGQPHYLALENNQTVKQLAAEAAQNFLPPEAVPAGGELPAIAAASAPVGVPAPAPVAATVAAPQPLPLPPLNSNARAANAEDSKPKSFGDAFNGPAASKAAAASFTQKKTGWVSEPRIQKMPAKAAKPSVRELAGGDHLVQLGSFSSEERAKKAWTIYADQYADLNQYEMVITKARVRGKTYYRVSAGGLAKLAASSMCNRVKARGEGCFAWSAGKPMPGAVDKGVRMARR